MSKQKPTKEIIRYWHPRLGGWYHGTVTATFLRKLREWHTVKPLAPKGAHNVNVPATDVQEVAA
jgi:hypothetical protein